MGRVPKAPAAEDKGGAPPFPSDVSRVDEPRQTERGSRFQVVIKEGARVAAVPLLSTARFGQQVRERRVRSIDHEPMASSRRTHHIASRPGCLDTATGGLSGVMMADEADDE